MLCRDPHNSSYPAIHFTTHPMSSAQRDYRRLQPTRPLYRPHKRILPLPFSRASDSQCLTRWIVFVVHAGSFGESVPLSSGWRGFANRHRPYWGRFVVSPRLSLRVKDGWMTTWDDGCPFPGYIERRDERWGVETIKLNAVCWVLRMLKQRSCQRGY